MDQCGARCDFALDEPHVLSEHGWFGCSLLGIGISGEFKHQRESFNDHGDRRERQRELQPGTRPAAGNDSVVETGAGGDGEVYSCGESGMPGTLWNRML